MELCAANDYSSTNRLTIRYVYRNGESDNTRLYPITGSDQSHVDIRSDWASIFSPGSWFGFVRRHLYHSCQPKSFPGPRHAHNWSLSKLYRWVKLCRRSLLTKHNGHDVSPVLRSVFSHSLSQAIQRESKRYVRFSATPLRIHLQLEHFDCR